MLTLSNIPGGVQTHMLGQVEALNKHGLSATLFAADCHDAYSPLTVPFFDLGPSLKFSGNGSNLRLAFSPTFFKKALEQLNTYDIIHVHEPFYPFTLALIKRLLPPVVCTFHAKSDNNKSRLYQFSKFILNKTWERMTHRLAVSNEAKATVQNYFDGDVDIFPNGISFEKQAFVAKAEDCYSIAPKILFLGRNDKRKGVTVLLESFPKIREHYPDAELWLVGPGMDELQADGIISFGTVDDQHRRQLLKQASCVCTPSLGGESFGIVLLEALAAQTPLVASNIPGYRDVARHNIEALLFEAGNSKQLSQSVIDVLSNPETRNERIQNGLKRCEAFSWENLSSQLISLYQQLCIPKTAEVKTI